MLGVTISRLTSESVRTAIQRSSSAWASVARQGKEQVTVPVVVEDFVATGDTEDPFSQECVLWVDDEVRMAWIGDCRIHGIE